MYGALLFVLLAGAIVAWLLIDVARARTKDGNERYGTPKAKTVTIQAWTYRLGVPITDPKGPYRGHKVGCCWESPMCCGCSCGYFTLIHCDSLSDADNERLGGQVVRNTTPVPKKIEPTKNVTQGRARP